MSLLKTLEKTRLQKTVALLILTAWMLIPLAMATPAAAQPSEGPVLDGTTENHEVDPDPNPAPVIHLWPSGSEGSQSASPGSEEAGWLAAFSAWLTAWTKKFTLG